MHNHTNEPGRESNHEIFARVKKEMDEPRMTESAREKQERQPDHAAAGKISSMLEWMRQMEKK